jgi:two-component system chemotaxis response regulator CheY
MIDLASELAGEFLADSREHLDSMEADLLAFEKSRLRTDDERLDRILRAVHTIGGGARSLQLLKIGALAHQTENILTLIRGRQLVLTPETLGVLLRATGSMRDLVRNAGASDQADIAGLMAALSGVRQDHRPLVVTPAGQGSKAGLPLRTLLVEDDFASRVLLQTFLSRYGECHIAVNGREAVDAARSLLERGRRYDLICMDIMMPEMDGREAVRQIRALEEEHGILSTYGTKIIMTTAVDDVKEVIRCFRELCDSYLTKPIDLGELLSQMRSCGLVE